MFLSQFNFDMFFYLINYYYYFSDIFNILSVLIFLPIELIVASLNNGSGYLKVVSKLIVESTSSNSTISNPNFMKEITGPFVDLIIQLDKEVLKILGTNASDGTEKLIKHNCTNPPDNKCKFAVYYSIFLCFNLNLFIGIFLFETADWDEWVIGKNLKKLICFYL